MTLKPAVEDEWYTVDQIDETTFVISEYGHWEEVHSFLLLGEEKAVLIDAGLGISSMRNITDQLTDLPIQVLLTHVHWDHIGNLAEYEHIFVHPADAKWLEKGIGGLSDQHVRQELTRNLSRMLPESFIADQYTLYKGKAEGLLVDGKCLDIGGRQIRILHTPGHSPGHVCFYDEIRGYLFTGDLLYRDAPIAAFYPSTEPSDLVDSLDKISKLSNVKKIYGSHHTLGITPEVMKEVKSAVTYLREQHLDRFGTGLHKFDGFSIRF